MSDEQTTRVPKQQRFIEEYLKDFNGTQAAIRAGYAKSGAATEAWRLLRNADIKKEISRLSSELILTPEDTTKMMSDIARASINDYLVLRKVERRKRIKKPLIEVIQGVKDKISFEYEFVKRVPFVNEEDEIEFKKMISSLERQVVRYDIELERNPKAFRIEFSEPELVDEVELDLVKVKKDKEGGKIKSFKYGKFGPEIEFYAADSMLVNVARIHGLFKDSLDVGLNGSISIDKWLEDNSDDEEAEEEDDD